MKFTSFLAALALMMQTACAQTGGTSKTGSRGASNSSTAPSNAARHEPAPRAVVGGRSGGGGFGGGGFGGAGYGDGQNNAARIYEQLAQNDNGAGRWLLLNTDGNPRPTEKGAYLGVGVTPVPAVVRDQLKLQRGMGLVANFIEKESPAEAAGLHENDILTKLDDQLLVNAQQFAVLVRLHKVDEPLKITVIREAKPMELTAKLVERDLAVVDYSAPARTDYTLYPRAINFAAEPLRASPFGSGGTFQMESSDDQHTFAVTQTNGHSNLIARDKDGKVLFEGPIDTDEQIAKVPESIRPKVQKLRKWPTSMPMNTFRYIPPGSSMAPTTTPPAVPVAPAPTTPSRRATGAEPSY